MQEAQTARLPQGNLRVGRVDGWSHSATCARGQDPAYRPTHRHQSLLFFLQMRGVIETCQRRAARTNRHSRNGRAIKGTSP